MDLDFSWWACNGRNYAPFYCIITNLQRPCLQSTKSPHCWHAILKASLDSSNYGKYAHSHRTSCLHWRLVNISHVHILSHVPKTHWACGNGTDQLANGRKFLQAERHWQDPERPQSRGVHCRICNITKGAHRLFGPRPRAVRSSYYSIEAYLQSWVSAWHRIPSASQ